MIDIEAATGSYLELATSLNDRRLVEADLLEATRSLPALNRPLLEHLIQVGESYQRNRPRQGWALAAVTNAAAGHVKDIFLQGLAAWHLAVAANDWMRPQRVEAAADRAYTLFQQIDEPVWMAAATWQRNALPWTRPNFDRARRALEEALVTLETAAQEEAQKDPFALFSALCRLSLAHAQFLAGDDEAAAANVSLSEVYFQESPRSDPFYLGRCHFVWAALYRRGSQMAAATTHMEKALAIFEEIDARSFIAQTLCQRAYIQLQGKTQYQDALHSFSQAAARSAALDLPLWEAVCLHGKAQVFIVTGQLADAREALQKARSVYKQYGVLGLLSDALLDSGWMEKFYANFEESLTYFSEAQTLSSKMGYELMSALTDMHRAEVHVALGRYQYALASLEKAEEALAKMNLPSRQGECELRLADVWSQLGQPARAHAHLDQATAHFEEAKRVGVLAYLHTRRAEILFGEGNFHDAASVLKKALAKAEEQDNQPTAARARRYLGQALCATGRVAEAANHLQAAEAAYRRMQMSHEQAACQVAWGHCHRRQGDARSARQAWHRALDLSEGTMPDIVWQSHAGLAQLAETEGDDATALSHYRKVVRALEHLRRRLWQPTLVDAFLQRPATALDQAVALAARQGQSLEALAFIEASKAQTTAHRLLAEHRQYAPSQSKALQDLAAEIRWLYREIQTSVANHTGWNRPSREQELRRRLSRAIQEHDRLSARLERTVQSSDATMAVDNFNLDVLRRYLETVLGDRWLALDYYHTEEQLICVTVTPDDCHTTMTKLSSRAYATLDRLGRSGRRGDELTEKDLLSLGRALIPETIQSRLRPDTHLLIAPHRTLHHLPWAALSLSLNEKPLVAHCIPLMAPSLHTLALLGQRTARETNANRPSLLLAVSDFRGRHPSLPAVEKETGALLDILGAETTLLANEDATWPTLQRLADGTGLSHFALLHVASHAFHDPHSGRLSGLALHDRDVWLEDLKQCAPLPPVVILSACSGSVSRIYEGDEHVSLTTTCLVAGAQSVIGSIWPVPDVETANPILNVYENLANGVSVAEALARAQRDAWKHGLAVSRWGGFRCTGLPA